MERRKRKVPGGVKMQRMFRKLQIEHVRILRSLNYYNNCEDMC